ncbi:methyltransferase domain-containing protein [bacterium]|nr:methyltransferase domain-containing protein [bacterium]
MLRFDPRDPVRHNRAAWNQQAVAGSRWSNPVGSDVIARAREGRPEIVLTPTRVVPDRWLGDLGGVRVLGLASGGGQQMPVLAAAGADVVSLDLSEVQLARDCGVAARDGLSLAAVHADMAQLPLRDGTFDLIVNPVSTCFASDVRAVWHECARVLRPGGRLITGFLNPAFFLFDADEADRNGRLVVANRLPYDERDLDRLPPGRRAEIEAGETIDFSHSLEDLIGGQTAAGFVIADLYEDGWSPDAEQPLDAFMPSFVATLAVKA